MKLSYKSEVAAKKDPYNQSPIEQNAYVDFDEDDHDPNADLFIVAIFIFFAGLIAGFFILMYVIYDLLLIGTPIVRILSAIVLVSFLGSLAYRRMKSTNQNEN
jgi:hypothetical protein